MVLEHSFILSHTCVGGSEKNTMCSVACQNLVSEVFVENGLPEGISRIVTGNYSVGEMMTTDTRIPLISAIILQEWVKLLALQMKGLENHCWS